MAGPSGCVGGLPPEGITVAQFNAGSHESNGQNQTQIRTIQDTGAQNANQIRFVFNGNEGGGANSANRLHRGRCTG